MRLNSLIGAPALFFVGLLWFSLAVFGQGLRTGSAASRLGLDISPQRLTSPDRSVNFIVALVDNEPITNHDVQLAMQSMLAQSRQAGVSVPSDNLTDALELLIFERSQLQWAEQSGIRVSEEELQSLVQTVASRNQLSLDDFERQLERQGVSKKRFLQNLREQQMLQKLRDREVPARINITDVEITRFLTRQKAELAQKGQLELAQILLSVSDDASPAQVAQAEQTIRQWRRDIEQGADFFELARQRSQAMDRQQGGRMGLRDLDRYPDIFLQSTHLLPVGGVAGPVRSGAGFHLLKVVERQQSDSLTMEQTRVRHILLKPGGSRSQASVRARMFQFKNAIERKQADFAQLAREQSEDASAPEGGDLGWATPGQFVPEFEQVMNQLQPGQVSDPVMTRFGVHLIEVLERRKVPLTPQQAREYARTALRETKFADALDTWAKEVRGRAFIEYREPPQ